jgi:hypothetical protein
VGKALAAVLDPRNKSKGMQAQDEGGVRGEVSSNLVVSLSNHGKARAAVLRQAQDEDGACGKGVSSSWEA